MATAQKHARTETRTVTEEVTTYTLELSAEEHGSLLDFLNRRYGHASNAGLTDVVHALTNADAPNDPAPLAVGDRVRVLRWYLESDGYVARPGTYTVTTTPKGEPEFLAKRDGYGTHLLPAAGEGTVWERVS